MLGKVRIVLWAIVALVAVSATVIYLTKPIQPSGAMFGGPFEMVATSTGETFTQDDLIGTPTLMFFGFTHCPDVCPNTLYETQVWKERLGLADSDLRVLFVTVDPSRDTLDVMREYLSPLDGVVGLVGNEAQTDEIKRSYGVFSEQVEEDGSSQYSVNHTASVFMIDDEGNFFGTITYQEDTQTALDKVKRLIET
ncbi:SCO family protein [Pelagibacterium sp.]|uniref:SCO family protein n=1 Tax=Pelagibacterium sp. TaxID=1967288 RepID=UPI003A926892